MFVFDKYDVEIHVDLPNGVYLFDDEASTGKTRLCNELKALHQIGVVDVYGYTYQDRVDTSFEMVFNRGKRKLVVLDRYDMYMGEAARYIERYRNDMIILIDCKGEFNDIDSDDWDYCYIELGVHSIKVGGVSYVFTGILR